MYQSKLNDEYVAKYTVQEFTQWNNSWGVSFNHWKSIYNVTNISDMQKVEGLVWQCDKSFTVRNTWSLQDFLLNE